MADVKVWQSCNIWVSALSAIWELCMCISAHLGPDGHRRESNTVPESAKSTSQPIGLSKAGSSWSSCYAPEIAAPVSCQDRTGHHFSQTPLFVLVCNHLSLFTAIHNYLVISPYFPCRRLSYIPHVQYVPAAIFFYFYDFVVNSSPFATIWRPSNLN